MKWTGILWVVLSCLVAAWGEVANELASDPVIARVLGREIRSSEQEDLSGIIFGVLLEQYVKNHSVTPTPADLDAFVQSSRRQKDEQHKEWETKRQEVLEQLKSKELSEAERDERQAELDMYKDFLETDAQMAGYEAQHPEESRQMEEEMARSFVQSWKVNQALYRQYGGRVIFQQAGSEPLDAYRAFLKEQEAAGAFTIMDTQAAASFWNYFTNDSLHTFYSKEEGEKFMSTPWWLMEKAAE